MTCGTRCGADCGAHRGSARGSHGPATPTVSAHASRQHPWVIALAGNPNTGKSTVFNALTGLRQHTGNWSGKTVAKAQGRYTHRDDTFGLVDLPGTYSLVANSPDDEVARAFLEQGRPDCTVIVLDATCIERNLNLAFQVMALTSRVVVCVNLIDEARRKGMAIDTRELSRQLGVPVVATAARRHEGLAALRDAVADVAAGRVTPSPRLPVPAHEIAAVAHFNAAEVIARRCVSQGPRLWTLEARLDRLLTHPLWGWPMMLLVLAGVFWITVVGANVPSIFLAGLLMEPGGLNEAMTTYLGIDAPGWLSISLYELLHLGAQAIGAPAWLSGAMIDGVYLCLAWVVSVMLPPMAIFFPLFTLLEDVGYLPRVAFNLDPLFKRCGAHGKQALTMAMGFGCNAAGVVACRVIDSPRERLIAILTNPFMICNGRFPTVIAISSLMLASGIASSWLSSTVAAAVVVGVVLLGVVISFIVSWVLSRTVLRGEPSAFALELPPYRRPAVWHVLYTSLIDRTVFVLARACVVAAPAGLVIWLVAHVNVAGEPLAAYAVRALDPIGGALGLSGIILLAYIIAIPANEIVVPVILMLMVLLGGDLGLGLADGRMIEPGDTEMVALLHAHGWTTLTSICLLLFVLLHNPCGTTIWTTWKETRSVKWTLVATFLPLTLGVAACALVAAVA